LFVRNGKRIVLVPAELSDPKHLEKDATQVWREGGEGGREGGREGRTHNKCGSKFLRPLGGHSIFRSYPVRPGRTR